VEAQPITYGPWQQIKSLYKLAEADKSASPELLGALISRIDFARLEMPHNEPVIKPSRRGRVISVALSQERVCVLVDSGPRAPAELFIYRLDPADPARPKEIGVLQAPSGTSVLMCGMQAVLVSIGGAAKDFKTLTIIDCSGRAPTVLGQLTEQVRGICSDDRYLYVATESPEFSGVVIRALMPGSVPREVGRIAIQKAGDIAVDGNMLYALSGGQSLSLRGLPKPAGLRIVDIAHPDRPRLVGSVNLVGASGVKASGGLAVVNRNRSPILGGGLYVVDVRDPAKASEIAFLGTAANLRLNAAMGAAVFATGQNGGLITIDLRDPRKPSVVQGRDPYWLACFDSHRLFAAGGSYGGVYLFNAANPFTLTPLGAPPSRKTMGYMKRRTRRFMIRLAKADPDRFAAVAFSILSKQTSPVDTDVQWQTMDLLYGASDLYRHTRHGRGTYKPATSRFVFRRPVERGHEAWVRHPELAANLLGMEDLDPAVHELGYRTILASGAAPPDIGDAMAVRFLAGNSAILRSAAVRVMAKHLSSPLSMPPEAAADLYLAGGRSVRKALSDAIIESANKNADWRKKFAARLFEHAAGRLPGIPLSRRESSALAFLARHLRELVPAQKVVAFSGAFLKSGNIDLVDLALVSAREENTASLPRWLADIDQCSENIRRRAVLALMEAVVGRPFTIQTATSLTQSRSSFIRSAGWELLGASSTAEKVLRPLIQSILEKPADDPALQSMLGSGAALGLLHRAGIDMSAFMSIVQERPALAAYLTAEVLTTLSGDLPVEHVVSLIGSATDELWERMRPGWLRNMREGLVNGSLWQAVGNALGGENAQNLTRRILDDNELTAMFIESDDDSILQLTSPAMEHLIFAWAQRREARFVRGSDLLLQASTHRLVSIREWALDRVRAQGMDLAFALRLLESELPASFDTGRILFDAATDEEVTRFALALCDSPSASVRAFGRFYVREHWDVIPHVAMIQDLFEGGTPDMQGFTAALLETEAERPEAGATFDRDILRTRSRARRAKESVKRRQETEHSVDIATLTALARGGVKRDAEWALAELAKRALSGEPVNAVRIDGIAGG
jgi:hypothetical protein